MKRNSACLKVFTTFAVFQLVTCALLFAQSPRVTLVENAGGQLGSDFTVRCQGERLNDVTDVLFYEPGLSLLEIEAVDSSAVDIRMNSTPDCRLGEHAFRLISPDGISELRSVHIGPYEHVDEEEPNNQIANPQRIDSGVTIRGLVEDGDIDTFQVDLAEGERVSAEAVALRLGNYLFDASLAIIDADGNVLVASDDTPLLKQEPIVSFQAQEAGSYFVQIRESAFGGDLDSVYQLHIGSHPRPTVAYPAGGMRGDELTTTLIGDGTGPIVTTIQLPLSEGADLAHYPEEDGKIAPSPINLRLSDFPNVLELEPNNSPATATNCAIRPSFALNGVLGTDGDQDVFRFRLDAGDTFDIEVFAARIGSPLDSVIVILGPDGRELVRNDDGALHDSVVRLVAPIGGEYMLAIRDHLGRGAADFVYRVEFTPITPSLELAIPLASQRRPQERQAIELSPGNRFVLLVSARRNGVRGPVNLDFPDLPASVRVSTTEIEADSHLTYVVFEASEDASLANYLVPIHGRADDPQRGSVLGKLNQETGLVFGPPRQTPYHSISVDRIPIVIKESLPFKLDVRSPSMPIVQDGTLSLKVVAERSDGYDGPIKLSLPFLPPWIEVPEDEVSIPAGESQVDFPLTATAEAEPRAWKIVVMGSAAIDGENAFASSAPVDIRVAERFADLKLARSVAEQDSKVQISADLSWKSDDHGQAVAHLRGLPLGVTTTEVAVTPDTEKLVFPVNVAADAWAAVHNTLYVELVSTRDGETVSHYLSRGGVLEIFEKGKKPSETLSRLEVLRRRAGKS